MKLKTLKEMEKIGFICSADIPEKLPSSDMISATELRQEAIKWIKHYRDMNEKDDIDNTNIEAGNVLVQIWIMHFFNIKEEE